MTMIKGGITQLGEQKHQINKRNISFRFRDIQVF